MNSELRKFVAPEFIFGEGALKLTGQYIKNFGADEALIVTDEGIIKAGWLNKLLETIEQYDINYTIFSDVTPNPRDHEVMKGAEIYNKNRCNVIVALGGGSPIDCAKGIGIVSSNKKDILEFEGVDMVSMPGPPLICIPTTAGTSADVSQFSIIRDSDRKVKIAIISKALVPDISLIDPLATITMDPYLTACTGMDALVHAIEAFVSNAHSPITDLHAMEAIRLITKYLLSAVTTPDSLEARNKMMLGSLHAGLAFSNASLGAVHAMAHSLGGLLDTPHGEANAILLSHVVNYNFNSLPERYGHIGETMGVKMKGLTAEEKKKNLIHKLIQLREEVGINKTLSQIGIQKIHIPELAKNAIEDACIVTNPRKPSEKDIEVIYEEAF
jgi:alcohol dehydrogenase class IV